MIGRVPAHLLRRGRPGGLRVVLAHGLEDGWSCWQGLVGRLDPDWSVRALDLPWRAGNDYRWRQRGGAAGWLAAGLDGLDEPVDALVAHSFGANAALELMAAGDQRVGRAVVLICPLYRPPEAPVTWRMFDRARRSFEAHIRDGVRARMGPRVASVEPDVLESMMDKALDRVGPIGLLTVFESFVASTDLALETIGQRAMVLAGGADRTLSATAARMLAARIPAAAVRVDESFDHFCHVRRPLRVAEQVGEFLRVPALQSVEGGVR
jgi:pimeloyl-ACP methyl ester carboxylesterase